MSDEQTIELSQRVSEWKGRAEKAEARVAELEAKLSGLHGIIRRTEADAREAILGGLEELTAMAENAIIRGADACTKFGPCGGHPADSVGTEENHGGADLAAGQPRVQGRGEETGEAPGTSAGKEGPGERAEEAPVPGVVVINPGVSVRLRASKACTGIADGWVGHSIVRVAWDRGNRTEVFASELEACSSEARTCGKRVGYGLGIRGIGRCKLAEGHSGGCNPRTNEARADRHEGACNYDLKCSKGTRGCTVDNARTDKAVIAVDDADEVLDALAASIADGEIDHDDIKGPVAAKRAAIELLRQVRIGLAIDPSSNRLRNEPAPIGAVTCVNCGRSSDDPSGSACPSGGGPQHDWEERPPEDAPPIDGSRGDPSGESIGSCSNCGEERDEPHTWQACAERLAAEFHRMCEMAYDSEHARKLLADTQACSETASLDGECNARCGACDADLYCERCAIKATETDR